MPIVYYKQNL